MLLRFCLDAVLVSHDALEFVALTNTYECGGSGRVPSGVGGCDSDAEAAPLLVGVMDVAAAGGGAVSEAPERGTGERRPDVAGDDAKGGAPSDA
jgi:hypothetical protein